MKRLIVSADDFGWTQGINRAIVEAHELGIVTSASLVAGGGAFEDAVRRAKSLPKLGLGVHLTLVNGRPVLAPQLVPTLVRRNGRFYDSPFIFVAQLALGKIKIGDIERELRAQITRVLDAGVRVNHVDGHKHLHIYPKILSIVVKLTRGFGITKIRLPLERPNQKATSGPLSLSHLLISLAARSGKRKLLDAKMIFPENFFGLFHTGSIDKAILREVLENLPDGTSEIMCHPGYDDEELQGIKTRLRNQRWQELQALASPEISDLVKKNNIKLINYDDIA